MQLQQCQDNYSSPPICGFWHFIGRCLQQLGKRIEKRALLNVQRRQLLEMDERMLKDIGLSRCDVHRLTGQGWYWESPGHADSFVDSRFRRS